MFNRFLSPAVLICTAIFALAWSVARAAIQSITIDEANTYLMWVAPGGSYVWTPHSNNHVLNSLLIRFFTSVFGLSPITVRLPALIGAAVYVAAAFYLCRLITSNQALRWALFVCLTYNPFVLDFLVAARGYSLAMAFLMWTVAVPAGVLKAKSEPAERSLLWACGASSVCAALSFTANFSFAFADAAILLLILLWICRGTVPAHPATQRLGPYARLLAATTIPGLLVAFALCGSVVRHFPKGELFYGATSLGETLKSVIGPSLYELNPHLLNPALYAALAPRRNVLLPLLGAITAWQLILLYRNRSALSSLSARWQRDLAIVLAGCAILALCAHWISFRLLGVLMPKDRTGIYLVLFTTLAVGLIAAIPAPSNAGRVCRGMLISMLFVMAAYFVLCLRLTYFREWKYDADVNQGFPVIASYSRTLNSRTEGIQKIPSHWLYAPSLNFYSKLTHNEKAVEFSGIAPYPADEQVYVLFYPEDKGFIEKNGLRVVYHGQLSDMVVAVRPDSGIAIPPPGGAEPMRDPLFWTRYQRALEALKR